MTPFSSLSNLYVISGHRHFLTLASVLKALRGYRQFGSRAPEPFSGESSSPTRTDAAEFDGEFNPVLNGIEGEKDCERKGTREKERGEGQGAKELPRASVISFGESFFKLLWDE